MGDPWCDPAANSAAEGRAVAERRCRAAAAEGTATERAKAAAARALPSSSLGKKYSCLDGRWVCALVGGWVGCPSRCFTTHPESWTQPIGLELAKPAASAPTHPEGNGQPLGEVESDGVHDDVQVVVDDVGLRRVVQQHQLAAGG